MITKIIGHILFPRSPAWERQRRVNTTLIVVFCTVTFALVLGGLMYWMNSSR